MEAADALVEKYGVASHLEREAMRLSESNLNCQIPCLQMIATGRAEVPPQSLARRAKVFVRRHLTPGRERTFKTFTDGWMNRFALWRGKSAKPRVALSESTVQTLQAGDKVRVRSLEEIQDTLNNWQQLKGCTFMPEMATYCGTVQRVLKPLQRFVDERDLRVKRSTGIILLDGVMCQGTADFGSCDRSCFYFWRAEWLEKIDLTGAEPGQQSGF